MGQRTDEQAEYAPERLFTRLDPRPSDHFLALVEARPLRSLALYVIGSLLFVWVITLSQTRAHTTLWLDVTPHVAVIPLVLGLFILPRRFLWVPVLIYPLGEAAALACRALLTPGYLNRAELPMVEVASALYVLAVALAAVAARWMHDRLLRHGVGYRADIALAVATALCTGVFGAVVTLWLLDVPQIGAVFAQWVADGDLTVKDLAVLRFVTLGGTAGLLFLTCLERGSASRGRIVLLGLGIGGFAGLMSRSGFGLHPGIDICLPLIAIALISRSGHAASLSVAALLVYEIVTQQFARLPEVSTHSDHLLEVYSALALVLLFGVCLRRLASTEETSHSRRAIARLEQVQKFVSVGYFVVDPAAGEVFVDPTGARILGTAQRFGVQDFLVRVAPNDLPAIMDALEDTRSVSRRFAFHMAEQGAWHAAAATRFMSVFIWYDDRPSGTRIAYGAVLDLTVEDEREKELRATLARLSDQQSKQTQLFSIVSHELRTPAALISMLNDEMAETGDWAAVGPKMRNVTEHLLSVLADMRQAVRPDQNLPVHLESVVPLAKLERLRNNFANLAKQNGFSIQIEGGSESGQAQMIDRTRLNQAMSNLIKNAIVHSGGRTVFLSYREEAGGVGLWSVADDGKGIPAGMRDVLFQPFSRLHRGGDRHVDGSGLGLYVVKTAMEMLGGSVTVGDREGGGTRFEIRLPMAASPSDGALPEAAAGARRDIWAGTSVLVVEDSELMAELLVKRLVAVFGKVSLARNGKEALERHLHEPHDIVLTDLFMPGMAGDQLTRALRELGYTGRVIGMTAASIGEDRLGFENAGTDAVITKPVRMEDLLAALERSGLA